MSEKSERLSGHFEEFLLSCSYGADGSGPELESVRKEVWEQDVWCSSHSGHRARGPCTCLPCHPRASAVEEALGNQHSEMAVHLPLPLSCVESVCKYGNGSHAGSSAWAHKYGLSFTRADPLLGITLQPCGDTLTVSVLFQHWRGSVLIPSEWTHILGQICPPAHTASTCITSYRLTECCFHDHIVPQNISSSIGADFTAEKGQGRVCAQRILWFYLSPPWPRILPLTLMTQEQSHYQLWYNTL